MNETDRMIEFLTAGGEIEADAVLAYLDSMTPEKIAEEIAESEVEQFDVGAVDWELVRAHFE